MLTHYARTAPLATITRDFNERRKRDSMSTNLDGIKATLQRVRENDAEAPTATPSFSSELLAALQGRLSELDKFTRSHILQEIEALKAVDASSRCLVPRYIVNRGVWHRTSATPWAPQYLQATSCGWRFPGSGALWEDGPPRAGDRRCEKCFRSELTADSDDE